ncbi:putative manganese-dependent inorganic diphosphatase [Haloferula rosea]|uniref:inorganic diphosphatase n=1 Tax=Haloferula rosea TaxID=490093 RepID=A0A934RFF6_9BACT|nr:putative manganese-dependent inorganic diphosphatase [Haloferula rosea]MBK1827400.1 putative manganese-dependent inorganic diphosphatase [Haloferula rosea]
MPAPRLPFYVIGHLNPDTDAICSAIGHAALLRETGEPDATAARCGQVPPRTAWVLEKAGIPQPELVEDVRATAGMICRRNVVWAKAGDTFLAAYRSMLANGVRCVPVVDGNNRPTGILRYLDLLELLLPGDGSDMMARMIQVALRKVATTLNAESVGADLPEGSDDEDLIVLVGASSQATVNRRLKAATKEGTIGRYLVMCGDRPVVQHYAIEHGARALLVTGDNGVEPQLREMAKQKGVIILLCSQDTASATTLIRCSRTVGQVMERQFQTVTTGEPVVRLRKSLASLDQDLFPVVDRVSGEMEGVLSKSDLVDPPRTRVALVDHNEYAQAVRGVEDAHVVEVIDHHRLAGDLISREPIRYLNEPVGSTSTLVGRKFLHRDLEPEPGVAMCLCAGIISDTLCLTSPTTTDLDRRMLEWLSGIAGVKPEEFKSEFFAVGSLLASGSVDEVLNADRKEFLDEGVRITIAQIEELGLEAFDDRRKVLEEGLAKLAADERFDIAVLAVTDIAKHHSLVLAAGDERLVRAIPFEAIDDTLFSAHGVVSRKKQIFPAVCQAVRTTR